jgi:multiple sugar transport system substrate-binding protein
MNRRTLLLGATLASMLMTSTAFAATELSMWYHGAGNPVEREILIGIINDFNGSQADWTINH